MLKKLTFSSRLTFILKSLLISYLLTAGLLLLLALFLYKFSMTEKIVSLCITGLYILGPFLEGSRKFLWGLLMGCLYFIILTLVSLIVNHGMGDLSSGFFATLILCAASGMLGGMLS